MHDKIIFNADPYQSIQSAPQEDSNALMIRKHTVYFTLWLILALATSACGSADTMADDGKSTVVATTGHIADAISNIAGDTINLISLLGPGIDPHLYVPTEGDVSAFSEASLIVYNGLDLEAQMSRVLEQMESRGVAILAVGNALPTDQLLNWDSEYPNDPHVWNDPLLWSTAVELMRDQLIELNPTHTDLYMENTETYLATIAEADQFIQEQLQTIPEERRVLITAHDAFGYFGRQYGIEVVGLQGISTESEASTADIQELVNFIVTREIPAIFVETSVSPKTIEAVQAAAADQGLNVEIGGYLFSDALGEEGSGAETYVGMLRANATTLAKALGE